ncbi:hypothetical protein BgiBS90_015628 [Biomphalaria glabrata]|nr:hypothetical protein BgiBS90_015628 [Biomphalaria glabrata]
MSNTTKQSGDSKDLLTLIAMKVRGQQGPAHIDSNESEGTALSSKDLLTLIAMKVRGQHCPARTCSH